MGKIIAAIEVILGTVLMAMVMFMDTETAVRFGIGFAVMTICAEYAKEALR